MDGVEFISVAARYIISTVEVHCFCHVCITQRKHNIMCFDNNLRTGTKEYNENAYKLCKLSADYPLDPNFSIISDLSVNMIYVYKKYSENVIHVLSQGQFIALLYGIIRRNSINTKYRFDGYLKVLPDDIWHLIVAFC